MLPSITYASHFHMQNYVDADSHIEAESATFKVKHGSVSIPRGQPLIRWTLQFHCQAEENVPSLLTVSIDTVQCSCYRSINIKSLQYYVKNLGEAWGKVSSPRNIRIWPWLIQAKVTSELKCKVETADNLVN